MARDTKTRAERAAAIRKGEADPDQMIGIDGIVRKIDEEKRLNEMFAITFREQLGQDVLAYLRSITLDNISGPMVSDGELRHLEGQRYLARIILQRTNIGRTE